MAAAVEMNIRMPSPPTRTAAQARPKWTWPAVAAWAVALSALALWLPAHAQGDCVGCHKTLAGEGDGHAGLANGCKACHAGTDGSRVPHPPSGPLANGLAAPQPGLCQGCHDRPQYRKTNAHAVAAKGCTGCHTVHVSEHGRLLRAEVPALCHSCHEERQFKGKVTHKPVKKGACLDCHDAHSAQNWNMLLTEPQNACDECHEEIKEQPHAVAGFSGRGHPLGEAKNGDPARDPLRPTTRFYCGSCHDAHRSTYPTLMRFDVESPTGFCMRCHDK